MWKQNCKALASCSRRPCQAGPHGQAQGHATFRLLMGGLDYIQKFKLFEHVWLIRTSIILLLLVR